MAINVGQAVGYLDLDTSNFSKGLKSAYKELQAFSDSTKSLTERTTSLSKGLQGIGSTLSKNLTVPIAAAGAASLKAGIEFESAFAGIRKTVDATEQEFGKLRTGILEMAREMPQSASELAAVGEIAGQLGIQTENILDFTKAMVMLGDTTNLSSTEAATALSRFANITGMTQDNFDRLGSSIVKLGNNFATTEAEIASMALNIASAGTQIGLSESEILGFAAALSSVGIQAELGGTALSKVMVQMQLAVETGGTALHNFATVANMSVNEFKDAFQKDAASAIQAFIVGLSDTERLGTSTIKILNDMGIKEVRLRDTLLRAANASDVLNDAIEKSNQAWDENSALVDEANKRYETTESQLKILWNNIVELGIQIADILLPVFKDMVKGLQEFVKWLGSLDKGTLKVIVSAAAFVAALGPLLSIVGKVISIFTKLSSIITKLGPLLTALKTAISALSGPIGWVTLAVAGLTVAIIALSKGTSEQSERQKELNKYIAESKEAYDNSISSANEQTESLMANSISAKALIDDMYNLSEQEMDTATKVEILKNMNEQLESILPGVSLKIDEETGKIITQKDEVNNLIAAQIKLQATKIYSEKSAAEAKRYTEAIIANNKAVENAEVTYKEYEKQKQKVADMEKKAGELAWWDTRAKNNQNIAIAQQRVELNKLEKEYNGYKDIQEENNAILKESKENMAALQKEQKKVEKQIMESLGIQESANDETKKSEDSVTDNKRNNANQRNIITNDEIKSEEDAVKAAKKAEEERQKEAEKSLEAEKDRYEKLSEATKKYFDNVAEIEREAKTKLQEIYDEEAESIQEINDAYNDALERRKDAIRSQFGLFDEFVKETDDSLSGKELLKNLKSQLKGIQEWKKDLDSLAEKGVAQGLLDELKELGPKAAVEIDELNKLSDKKLQEYVETWEKLNAEIAQQAEEDMIPERENADAEIEKVKNETLTKVTELNAEVESKINEVGLKYMEGLQKLGVDASTVSKETGVAIIKAIEIGVDETEDDLLAKLENLKTEVTDIVRSIMRQVERAQGAAASIDGSHRSGLDYVPYDGYIAQLHQGERVLTQQENKEYNEGKVNVTSKNQTLNVNFTGSLGQLIRVLKPEFTLDDNRGGVVY